MGVGLSSDARLILEAVKECSDEAQAEVENKLREV